MRKFHPCSRQRSLRKDWKITFLILNLRENCLLFSSYFIFNCVIRFENGRRGGSWFVSRMKYCAICFVICRIMLLHDRELGIWWRIFISLHREIATNYHRPRRKRKFKSILKLNIWTLNFRKFKYLNIFNCLTSDGYLIPHMCNDNFTYDTGWN